METQEFLANNETNNDLTQYLAEKLVTALATAAYEIVFGNTCKTNIDINENLLDYNQEEDTDVFLTLLHYFEDICSSTTFKARNKEIYLRTVYEILGK